MVVLPLQFLQAVAGLALLNTNPQPRNFIFHDSLCSRFFPQNGKLHLWLIAFTRKPSFVSGRFWPIAAFHSMITGQQSTNQL